jgi:hypothetical protein
MLGMQSRVGESEAGPGDERSETASMACRATRSSICAAISHGRVQANAPPFQ